jgi:hypothetical protein
MNEKLNKSAAVLLTELGLERVVFVKKDLKTVPFTVVLVHEARNTNFRNFPNLKFSETHLLGIFANKIKQSFDGCF